MNFKYKLSKSTVCILLLLTTLFGSFAQASNRIKKCNGAADGLSGEFANLDFNITTTSKNIVITLVKYDATFLVIYTSGNGLLNVATSEKSYDLEFLTDLAEVEWTTNDSGTIRLGKKLSPTNNIGKNAQYDFVCK